MARKASNKGQAYPGQFPEYTATTVNNSVGSFPGQKWEPVVLNQKGKGKDEKAKEMGMNAGMKAHEFGKINQPAQDAFSQIGSEMTVAPQSVPNKTLNKSGNVNTFLSAVKAEFNDQSRATASTKDYKLGAQISALGVNPAANASEVGFSVGNDPLRSGFNRTTAMGVVPTRNQKPASTDIDVFQNPTSAQVNVNSAGVQMAQNSNPGSSPNPADRSQLTGEGGMKVQATPSFTDSFVANVSQQLSSTPLA